jgi:nucleotide-binding universal stress UspA family protein
MTANTGRGVTFEKILCPVDLSDFSKPVLAHAVALGRWYRADVTALHVFASWAPPASLATYPGWMMQVPEARESITKELRALTEPFASGGSAVPLRTSEGDASAEIVRAAADMHADLVVMGTHGRSGFDRLTLGSVTEKVLRKASCPVLTIPPNAPRTPDAVEYRRILCPTDFSECSTQALELATSLALTTRASITLLHVVETEGDESPSDQPDDVKELRRRRDAATSRLHASIASHIEPALDVATGVALGKPHREILRAAAEHHSDVIVMGVRGRGPVDLTLFGSTTNQVVRRSTCPVITVRSLREDL